MFTYPHGFMKGGVAGGTSDLFLNSVGYWAKDEESGTRFDSRNSNDLTDVNTVGFAAGKQSNAADFNAGFSETLSIAENASMALGDIDFAFAAWVYPHAINNTPIFGQIVNDGAVATIPFDLHTRAAAGNVWALIVGNGATGALLSAGPLSVDTNTWQYNIAWHDATANTINITKNNGAVQNAAYSGGSYAGGVPFYFGSNRGVTDFYDGLIDEAILWKNYIPTSADRTWLYNSGAGRNYTDLLAYSP